MSGGRLLAIGDIHGCDVALALMLHTFAPTPDDQIILLGDICDRGPNTSGVIEILLEWRERCDMRLVMGNHDEMMLAVFGRLPHGNLNFWWSVGGAETIESYGGDPNDVPESHLDFLESAEPYLESDSEIYVHASVRDTLPLHEQSIETLRWEKVTGYERPHASGRRVICGHTSQRSGNPLVWPGWACIDTRVYDPEGWLTALDVEADTIYQTNQFGQVRGPFPLHHFE